MTITAGDIVIIVVVLIGAIMAGLYFLNRWASKKMTDQQSMIEKTKQTATIYIIDKKKEKAQNSSLPQMVIDKLPRIYKLQKMPLVKAKIGPQIMTLLCDKKIYDALPVKKNVKVELAGIYIIGMAGYKTPKEMKAIAETKRQKQISENKLEPKWHEKALAFIKREKKAK